MHLVLYAGLMAAWPFPLDRHLVVAVPFILLAVMVGGLSLTSRLPARARWVVLGVPLALVIGGNVQRVVARHAIAGHCDRENPTGPGGCYNENERDFARAGT